MRIIYLRRSSFRSELLLQISYSLSIKNLPNFGDVFGLEATPFHLPSSHTHLLLTFIMNESVAFYYIYIYFFFLILP